MYGLEAIHTECHHGVPGFKDRVAREHAQGRLIPIVKFEQYDTGQTWRDYEALKASGLVEEVEWEE
jgi:hypothetical protein